MKLLRVIGMGVIALCIGTTQAFSAEDYSSYSIDLEANDKRGQVYYRKNCRTGCHEGTAEVKALSPMSKTQEEWENFASNLAEIPCIAKWPLGLKEKDLSDIFSYLYGGASDSPAPVS